MNDDEPAAAPFAEDPAEGGVRRAGSWIATIGLAALTGAITGAGVTAYELFTEKVLYEQALDLPPLAQAGLPLVGLVAAYLLLRYLAFGASPSTSDEYVRAFHLPGEQMAPDPVAGRMAAGSATLGSGGALGFEGPSLYLGASIGSALQRRFASVFRRADAKTLMVAGAAAGVAAIFKTPATGAVFALEVPYQDDTAHGYLLPALTGAATGYLIQVAILGTQPLFPVRGQPPFDLRELGGAIVLGLICGLGARLFAWLVRRAKASFATVPVGARIPIAGAVLAAAGWASWVLYGDLLALGSGYRVVDWLTDPNLSLAFVAGLLLLRTIATTATVAGGGVGGLFIPLAVSGALVGRILAGVIGEENTSLFEVVGVAAFLGAGFRTPLAGVMFVAEATGQPGFVVPGLLAAVASQLVMGRASVAFHQHRRRLGHLERRFDMPVAAVIDAELRTVPADVDLDEFLDTLLLSRQTVVPVVEGSRYLGLARVDQLVGIDRSDWSNRTVGEVADTTAPTVRPEWSIRQAVAAMEATDLDLLAVTDAEHRYIGVVRTEDIVRFDEILAQRDRHD